MLYLFLCLNKFEFGVEKKTKQENKAEQNKNKTKSS